MGWFSHKWRKGECTARALYIGATWVYDYKEKVRFIVKNIAPGTDHIQAQGWDSKKNQWRYLTMTGEFIDYGKDDFPNFETTKTLTWAELLHERIDAENRSGAVSST